MNQRKETNPEENQHHDGDNVLDDDEDDMNTFASPDWNEEPRAASAVTPTRSIANAKNSLDDSELYLDEDEDDFDASDVPRPKFAAQPMALHDDSYGNNASSHHDAEDWPREYNEQDSRYDDPQHDQEYYDDTHPSNNYDDQYYDPNYPHDGQYYDGHYDEHDDGGDGTYYDPQHPNNDGYSHDDYNDGQEQHPEQWNDDQYQQDPYYNTTEEEDPYYHDPQPPPEMARSAQDDEKYRLEQEKMGKERQEAAQRRHSARRFIWLIVACCLILIVLLIVGILALRKNDDDPTDRSVNATAATTRRPTTLTRPISNTTKTAPTSSPIKVVAPTVPTATAAPPVPTVPLQASVRLDLIGGTDLLNDFSNATLAESCALFLADHVAEATDMDCLVVNQELVQRDFRTRIRFRRALRRVAEQPALRVEILATALVPMTTTSTPTTTTPPAFDTDALVRLMQRPQASQAFVTILTNSEDGAFTSVTHIVLAEDMVLDDGSMADATSPTISPAPTPPLEPLSIPTVNAPSDGTTGSFPVDSGSTVAPTPLGGGGGGSAVLSPPPPPTNPPPTTPFPTASPTVPVDIRTKLEQTIGSDKFDTILSNPYNKALAWIETADPMSMTAYSPNLVQRFIAAYFYYATSILRDWASCGPHDTETSCTYLQVTDMNPLTIVEVPDSTRWLSSMDECSWVGVECDLTTAQIKKIELCTCSDH
jgi:hypothetical protein